MNVTHFAEWLRLIAFATACFFRQLADKAAADQPCEGLDEEIAGKMLALLYGPVSHRRVTRHGCGFPFVKDEARRPVRQPADVFEGFTNETAGLPD